MLQTVFGRFVRAVEKLYFVEKIGRFPTLTRGLDDKTNPSRGLIHVEYSGEFFRRGRNTSIDRDLKGDAGLCLEKSLQ